MQVLLVRKRDGQRVAEFDVQLSMPTGEGYHWPLPAADAELLLESVDARPKLLMLGAVRPGQGVVEAFIQRVDSACEPDEHPLLGV